MSFSKNAKPILDAGITEVLKKTHVFNSSKEYPLSFYSTLFIKEHEKWIKSSKQFIIAGLENFSNRYVTFGITDAFNDFYFLHKTISVLRGEYPYHRDLGLCVLDDIDEIEDCSALIISYPFSATGNIHKDWDRIISVCLKKQIAIFLDCSFFGIAENIVLDIAPCITHVAFSFSKVFCTGVMRTGVLYTKNTATTPLKLQHKWIYDNHLGQIMHYNLMKNFGPDYIITKYKTIANAVREQNFFTKSSTIIFGLTSDSNYDEYSRDGIINRITISRLLQS